MSQEHDLPSIVIPVSQQLLREESKTTSSINTLTFKQAEKHICMRLYFSFQRKQVLLQITSQALTMENPF